MVLVSDRMHAAACPLEPVDPLYRNTVIGMGPGESHPDAVLLVRRNRTR